MRSFKEQRREVSRKRGEKFQGREKRILKEER